MAVNKIGLTGETPEDINDGRIGDKGNLVYDIVVNENEQLTHNGQAITSEELMELIETKAPMCLHGVFDGNPLSLNSYAYLNNEILAFPIALDAGGIGVLSQFNITVATMEFDVAVNMFNFIEE